MSLVSFDGVSVSVPVPGQDRKQLLSGVDLRLDEPRIAVIGANGSGKSTLLRLINGLIVPSRGEVTVNGLSTRNQGSKVRRQVGFVFTDPLSQLVMPTGREDIELSLRASVRDRSSRHAAAERVLADFGLLELADQSIYDLSGGERQLLALATVLAVSPQILVADEPTTLLDLRNGIRIGRLLEELPQQLILSTHDLDLAARADRILVIDDGKVAYDGGPEAAIGFYRKLAAGGVQH
ncbi:energy-coupling factor ABC transporter ATP-binding protein [Arthrobacter monumenti]